MQVLVREPAGELDVLGADRAQLVDRVVEPLAGEHEAHVGQLARRLRERELTLLDERAAVDRADGQRQSLLARPASPNGSGTPWWTTVTRSGGIGVLRSISLRLYCELVISRPARRMIQRLAQRRSPPCW